MLVRGSARRPSRRSSPTWRSPARPPSRRRCARRRRAPAPPAERSPANRPRAVARRLTAPPPAWAPSETCAWSQKGFQLVEIMVCLAVMGIPAAARGAAALAALRRRCGCTLAAAELVGVLRPRALRGPPTAPTWRSNSAPGRTAPSPWPSTATATATASSPATSTPASTRWSPPRAAGGPRTRCASAFRPGRRRATRDPPGRFRRRTDPLRFNSSDLASFGPLGTSTPGSLYLTDGRTGSRGAGLSAAPAR